MDTAHDYAARLASLLRDEHRAMADFLVALADFDARRLWLRLGHASLFAFLHRQLGLSKGASHFRKVAVELIQRFPEVADHLRSGELCITSVVELARVLTPENRAEVLPRFFHASKQEAKAVAAELRPAEALARREVVTLLPSSASAVAARPASGELGPSLGAAPAPFRSSSPELGDAPALLLRQAGAEVRPVELESAGIQPLAPPCAPPPSSPRTQVEPLTAEARRLHVTVSKRFLEKLEVARQALSHSRPGAHAEAILEAGLDLLIERAAKRKGIVAKPRSRLRGGTPVKAAARKEPKARYIPAEVRREVWIRDGRRCQWPTADGGTCGSTWRVQYDHVVPVALGGESTVGNVRLLCAAHNDAAAREAFGDGWMDRFTGKTAGAAVPASSG
jgi:hypothetical protein